MNRIPISVDKPATGVRIAQALGLTASAYLAGAIGGISIMLTPSLLEAPAPLLVKQWNKMFERGKALAPPLSVVSSVVFGALAYRSPKDSAAVYLYSVAAILVPSIVPYTIFVMGSTNEKLISKASSLASTSITDAAAEAGVAKEETAHALVDKWATLNLVRSFLPLIGTICAAWAAVDNYEVLGLAEVSLRSGANRMG